MTGLILLLALPAAAQLKSVPLRAPVLTPGFAPVLAAPRLSPSLSPIKAVSLPAPALVSPILPAAQSVASAKAAVAAVKEAAPQAEKGERPGDAKVAARMDALFDGRGKLADRLAAPAAVDLTALPTAATPRVKSEKKAAARLARDLERINRYQEMLFARGERAVLLVFQGMDTGGKDGVIKTVVGAMNPQGVRVASFKKPTEAERRRHYLWRIKKALPEKGGVGVLNRSHYEDIVMPTVLETHPESVIELRYDEISRFEKALSEKGVVILKFFMHISKDEQKRRLQARLDEPEKNWKFSPADLEMRKKWDAFQKVWSRVLARTSKPWAPWHIIPADNKWYRDYAVARVLRKTFDRLGLSYPSGPENPGSIVIPD